METINGSTIPTNEDEYWTCGVEDSIPVTQASAPSAWQEYLDQHKHGNWMQALKVINRLAAFDPQQPEIWRAKSRLHGVLGHSACCSAAIQTLLQLVPNDLDALRMQALFLYCHQSHESALSICDSVLGKNPLQADFWALKADILKSRGRHDDASNACKRALQINPGCTAALRLQETLPNAA